MSDTHKRAPQLRALIYDRVSHDPSGRGLSVSDQDRENRAFCAQQGWTVVDTIVDNDRSASRWAAKARPGYKEVHRQLSDGNADVLVIWEASRAQRDLAVYVQLRDLCAALRILLAYNGRVYDLTRTDDRFTTGLDALLSEREADETRDRILRAVRSRAASGQPHGRIPYGYRRDYDPASGTILRQVPDDETAGVVRDIYRRALAGESLRRIALNLEERGIPCPAAHRALRLGLERPDFQWTMTSVRKILSNPTYIAQRVHKGKVVGDAQWPAIVDPVDFVTIERMLSDPQRRRPRGTEPVHLLSGILECGVCGSRCRQLPNRGRRSYVCMGRVGISRGCVSRQQDRVDAMVIGRMVERLGMPDLRERLAASVGDGAAEAAARELVQLQAQLDSYYENATSISVSGMAKIEQRLLPMIEDARRRSTPSRVSPLVLDVAGPDAAAKWDAASTRAQREIVQSMCRIVMHKSPHQHGYRPFDESLIELIWHAP